MDISQLSRLGKVGGVPGIALGVAVLVLGAVINGAGLLPEVWRGPIFFAIAVGAVALAILAVLGWTRGTRAGAQVAKATGDGADASNVDKTKSTSRQRATATGANARASNIRE